MYICYIDQKCVNNMPYWVQAVENRLSAYISGSKVTRCAAFSGLSKYEER